MPATDMPVSGGVVVAGFDGSDEARWAVRWAAREAQRRALLIVHAVAWWPPTDPHGWAQSDRLSEDVFRQQTGEQLAAMAEDCRRGAPELSVYTTQRDGHPAVTLGVVAEEADAELIVIGATGLGALPWMQLGSTAADLVRASPRPLAVVRGKHDVEPMPSPLDDIPVMPVLLDVDGSPASQPAIAFAFEFAARHDCAVHAVHAWNDVPIDVNAAARDWMWAMATDVAEQHLADWTQRYPRVPVRIECVADRPAQALLDRADNAQLLVVGSHRHGVPWRAFLGSVSHAVLHHAPCPVAVVRAPTR
jgi:nucleotide-binding universal stress UspA family protein